MKSQTSILLLLTLFICGCNIDGSSRWAMDDPTYARRYSNAYPSNDAEKLYRKLKQSSDARHLADSTAVYFGTGASDAPFTIGADLGLLRYASDSIEQRIGLRGLAGTGEEDLMLGIDSGLRFQLPTRVTPFVGVGLLGAWSISGTPAEDDNRDNDGDDSIDEDGEKSLKLYAALYPEIGVSWWLNSRNRATLSVQHHFSTSGRDEDYTFFSLTLAYRNGASDPDKPPRKPVPEVDSLEANSEQSDTDTSGTPVLTNEPAVTSPQDNLGTIANPDAE